MVVVGVGVLDGWVVGDGDGEGEGEGVGDGTSGDGLGVGSTSPFSGCWSELSEPRYCAPTPKRAAIAIIPTMTPIIMLFIT
ncbi:hypothetical protein ACFLV3_03175 [Chloroflexota bacterium]